MADLVNVLVRQRLHDGLHGILSDWSYGSHVRWLSFIALVPQLVA